MLMPAEEMASSETSHTAPRLRGKKWFQIEIHQAGWNFLYPATLQTEQHSVMRRNFSVQKPGIYKPAACNVDRFFKRQGCRDPEIQTNSENYQ